jgi:predicted RNA binding protein with dsRBD fold (UPF0201 family)
VFPLGSHLTALASTRVFQNMLYRSLTRPKETWVTQEKNLDILVDAFKTCRNVILAFSVNKSVAFQGYVSFHPSQHSLITSSQKPKRAHLP